MSENLPTDTLNPKAMDFTPCPAIPRNINWYSNGQSLTWYLLQNISESKSFRVALWPRRGEPPINSEGRQRLTASLRLTLEIWADLRGKKGKKDEIVFCAHSVRVRLFNLRNRYLNLKELIDDADGAERGALIENLKVRTPYLGLLYKLSGECFLKNNKGGGTKGSLYQTSYKDLPRSSRDFKGGNFKDLLYQSSHKDLPRYNRGLKAADEEGPGQPNSKDLSRSNGNLEEDNAEGLPATKNQAPLHTPSLTQPVPTIPSSPTRKLFVEILKGRKRSRSLDYEEDVLEESPAASRQKLTRRLEDEELERRLDVEYQEKLVRKAALKEWRKAINKKPSTERKPPLESYNSRGGVVTPWHLILHGYGDGADQKNLESGNCHKTVYLSGDTSPWYD